MAPQPFKLSILDPLPSFQEQNKPMKLPHRFDNLVVVQAVYRTSVVVESAWWNLKPVVGASLQVSKAVTGLVIAVTKAVPEPFSPKTS
jgi:hypothetical protein